MKVSILASEIDREYKMRQMYKNKQKNKKKKEEKTNESQSKISS